MRLLELDGCDGLFTGQPFNRKDGSILGLYLFMLPDKTADRQKPQNDALPERFETVTFISATGNCANHEKQL